jgi:hypothetical protein
MRMCLQQLWAIGLLTWKAALRFRLFWALLILLSVSVVALPLLLKDDGTARGFTQILLTYNLSVIATLLGLATLWLACGTLARDIEDCSLQVVAVKPVPRWVIWLGKWLGLMALNAALLGLSGSSVYGLLHWRARRLPPEQQTVLRNEVLVARAALKPPRPNLEALVEQRFRERLEKTPVPPSEQAELRRQIEALCKAGIELAPSGYVKRWEIQLGPRRFFLRDEPLFLRVKFHAAQTNLTGTYKGLWQVGLPDQTRVWQQIKSLAADTYHEFAVAPNLFDADGRLVISFVNLEDVPLLFPIEDALEVLYREGGFGLNFARGLGIIWCWMGLLAAMGLAAASFLSFPVAAFCSGSLLVVVLSSGTMARVVEEGTVTGVDHETGVAIGSVVDKVMVPVFRALLKVINLAQQFSPVDALSTGRSITWDELGRAFGQVVVLLGGLCALFGITIFSRRELAGVQATP